MICTALLSMALSVSPQELQAWMDKKQELTSLVFDTGAKTFTMNDARQRPWCSGPYTLEGTELSGKCAVVPGEEMSFKLKLTRITDTEIRYDRTDCNRGQCDTDRDACWNPREKADCTLQPIFPDFAPKPSKAAIEKLIADGDGISLDVGHEGSSITIMLKPDRRFLVRGYLEKCKADATYTVTDAGISLSCADGKADIAVKKITSGAMLYGIRWTFRGKAAAEPDQCFKQRHGVTDDRFCGKRIELIPGAADHALYDAVVKSMQSPNPRRWADTPSNSTWRPVLFAGPQASTPRVKSEVFYVGEGNLPMAQATAKVLAPLIGEVQPKAWPGAWAHDVVVVVGSEK